MKKYEEGKYLVFRGPKAFPANSKIHVTIGPDLPSIEGPVLSTKSASFDFTTMKPLTVTCTSSLYNNSFNLSFNQPMASHIDYLVTAIL